MTALTITGVSGRITQTGSNASFDNLLDNKEGT